MRVLPIDALSREAKDFDPLSIRADLVFDDTHYVRTVLHKDPSLEIALLAFEDGQSSSIHHHRGSACVVRVLSGRFLERLFQEDLSSGLYLETGSRLLEPGTISGLDGLQIHQMSNALARARGVLVNFYSPPFS